MSAYPNSLSIISGTGPNWSKRVPQELKGALIIRFQYTFRNWENVIGVVAQRLQVVQIVDLDTWKMFTTSLCPYTFQDNLNPTSMPFHTWLA